MSLNLDFIVNYANQFLDDPKVFISGYPAMDRYGDMDFFIENKDNPEIMESIPFLYNRIIDTLNLCHEIILEKMKLNDSARELFIKIKVDNLKNIVNEKNVFTIQDYKDDFEFFLKGNFAIIGTRFWYNNSIKNELS